MASTDSTLFPVYGQAFYFKDVIKSSATGNPLTGGLTALTLNISKDGAAFAAAAGTVTEIGTTGWFTINLTIADMTAKTIVYNITASNANAVYATGEIKTLDLADFTGRAGSKTVLKLEQFIRQIWSFFMNRNKVQRGSGAYTVYQDDDTTSALTGVVSDDGTDGTRGKMS